MPNLRTAARIDDRGVDFDRFLCHEPAITCFQPGIARFPIRRFTDCEADFTFFPASGRKGEATMPVKINKPIVIEAAGNKPKQIEEFIGRVNSQTSELSIARMTSPGGWIEPGQKPEFTEYTLVLKGMLRVKTEAGVFDIHAGEAVIVNAHEWVQYSTPDEAGAEYMAVCLPAFSPDTVHRDE